MAPRQLGVAAGTVTGSAGRQADPRARRTLHEGHPQRVLDPAGRTFRIYTISGDNGPMSGYFDKRGQAIWNTQEATSPCSMTKVGRSWTASRPPLASLKSALSILSARALERSIHTLCAV